MLMNQLNVIGSSTPGISMGSVGHRPRSKSWNNTWLMAVVALSVMVARWLMWRKLDSCDTIWLCGNVRCVGTGLLRSSCDVVGAVADQEGSAAVWLI